MKIENIPVMNVTDKRTSITFQEFLETTKKLKVGQSFVLKSKDFPSNYRLALGMAPVWLGKKFMARKEKNGVRVGCIAEGMK